MSHYKIGVIVGSLRKESYNRKLAKFLIALAPPNLEMVDINIGELAIYNQDYDDESRPPLSWTEFREQMRTVDAVIFVTPEYNRSVPGVLKNALDVGSRPYGKSIWDTKPAAVISVSIGIRGGFGANHHLRQSLVYLNMPTMQQPEAYLGNAADLFSAEGELTNKSMCDFLQRFVTSFANWIVKIEID